MVLEANDKYVSSATSGNVENRTFGSCTSSTKMGTTTAAHALQNLTHVELSEADMKALEQLAAWLEHSTVIWLFCWSSWQGRWD